MWAADSENGNFNAPVCILVIILETDYNFKHSVDCLIARIKSQDSLLPFHLETLGFGVFEQTLITSSRATTVCTLRTKLHKMHFTKKAVWYKRTRQSSTSLLYILWFLSSFFFLALIPLHSVNECRLMKSVTHIPSSPRWRSLHGWTSVAKRLIQPWGWFQQWNPQYRCWNFRVDQHRVRLYISYCTEQFWYLEPKTNFAAVEFFNIEVQTPGLCKIRTLQIYIV